MGADEDGGQNQNQAVQGDHPRQRLRPRPDSPRVSDRKIGVLPIGLTIGNSAPTTSRVYLARAVSGPAIIAHCTWFGDGTCAIVMKAVALLGLTLNLL